MKVVLDSNIFISSFFWKGNPRKVFDRVTNGQDELFITDEILKEIMRVLSRKKFDLSIEEVEDYINIIESYSIKIICPNIEKRIINEPPRSRARTLGLDGVLNQIFESTTSGQSPEVCCSLVVLDSGLILL
jgi:putative PIN family toxin of toxin-antitoxin system